MGGPTIQHRNLGEPVIRFAQPRAATLRRDQTVSQALDELRGQELSEKIVYFYVVDEHGILVGVVPVRRLLMSLPDASIERIMVTKVVSIPATATVLEASEVLLQHRFMALPVVDQHRALKGVIDLAMFSDEFAGGTHQSTVDQAFQLIGVHVAMGRLRSPWARFRDRFPWLLSNIAGGMVCAVIASSYESLIATVTFLALFIPVVLALSESVSIQSMTLTLQTMPAGRRSWRQLARAARREIITALLLGIGSGTLVGLCAYLWKGTLLPSLSLGASIGLSMVVACMLGVTVPGVIRGLRVDPKIASGPLVLALGDVATLTCFFWLAATLVL